jgi:tRNA dimethylallyltransferase
MTGEMKSLLAIVGATASGKNTIAQEIAAKTGASLVSVDSRKIYRCMDVGTAKPKRALRKKYRYAMLNLVDPDQRFSAAEYARRARAIVAERLANDEPVILVGGSGFYLEAFIHGLAGLPTIERPVRQEVLADAARRGWPAIHADLKISDPEWAAGIDPNDKTRLLRATEVLRQTGKPISAWLRESTPESAPWAVDVVEIEHDREELWHRIEARTARMLKEGLVEETELLLEDGYTKDSPGLATVGYQETIDFLGGRISKEAMIEQIIVHTRQYAKRQRTWFRHRPYVRRIAAQDDVAQMIMESYRHPKGP